MMLTFVQIVHVYVTFVMFMLTMALNAQPAPILKFRRRLPRDTQLTYLANYNVITMPLPTIILFHTKLQIVSW